MISSKTRVHPTSFTVPSSRATAPVLLNALQYNIHRRTCVGSGYDTHIEEDTTKYGLGRCNEPMLRRHYTRTDIIYGYIVQHSIHAHTEFADSEVTSVDRATQAIQRL